MTSMRVAAVRTSIAVACSLPRNGGVQTVGLLLSFYAWGSSLDAKCGQKKALRAYTLSHGRVVPVMVGWNTFTALQYIDRGHHTSHRHRVYQACCRQTYSYAVPSYHISFNIIWMAKPNMKSRGLSEAGCIKRYTHARRD